MNDITTNPSVQAGIILGIDLCSEILWNTAIRIKDDRSQGYSERIAIIKVLRLIHDEIKTEMEKFVALPSQPPV